MQLSLCNPYKWDKDQESVVSDIIIGTCSSISHKAIRASSKIDLIRRLIVTRPGILSDGSIIARVPAKFDIRKARKG